MSRSSHSRILLHISSVLEVMRLQTETFCKGQFKLEFVLKKIGDKMRKESLLATTVCFFPMFFSSSLWHRLVKAEVNIIKVLSRRKPIFLSGKIHNCSCLSRVVFLLVTIFSLLLLSTQMKGTSPNSQSN